MSSLIALLAIVTFGEATFEAGAKKVPKSNEAKVTAVAKGAACGVLCCERVIFLYTKTTIPLSELIHPKYLSSPEGSTDQDLRKLLSDYKIESTTQTGLGLKALAFLDKPAILHVKKSEHMTHYNHWVLFLGVKDGKYLIADLPTPAVAFTAEELLSIWDGNAIVTSDQELSNFSFYIKWILYEFVPMFALIALPSAIWLTCFPNLQRRTVSHLIFVFIAVTFIGIVRNTLYEGGLSERFLAAINSPLEHDQKEVRESSDPQDFSGAVAIDARFQPDYYRGHINNSVNIPVFASRAQIRESMTGIERNEKLVIYCHSSGCSYSHTIAERLTELGYNNIVIYSPGWLGLVEKK